MNNTIRQEIETALSSLNEWSLPHPLSIQVSYTKKASHGDFSSNIALILSGRLGISSRQLAEKIVAKIDCSIADSPFEKIEIAGPGFINFFLKKSAWYPVIHQILSQGGQFGCSEMGRQEHLLVEFVSANPTGPLHVGHGRGAAYGDSLVRLLKAVGYKVHAEYYVNDAGRQMDILTISVWLRYLQICGEELVFPSNGYQGAYIHEIAKQLYSQYERQFYQSASQVFSDIPVDKPQEGDKERHIDGLILSAKVRLGVDNYKKIRDTGVNEILSDIKKDLNDFKVVFNQWFSENSLFETGFIDETIKRLKKRGFTYEKDSALWFASSRLGDDKDRVLLRENGQPTYFAADAAYRLAILEMRGFEKIINVLGADHHGYIPRIQAVIQALGYPVESLAVLLLQFVTLRRGKKKLAMSTRSGEFITLRELQEEVGSDVARFFYVLHQASQPIDFDLELAKEQSSDNPVYYVQYVYARISSVMRQLAVKQWTWDKVLGMGSLEQLKEKQELDLLMRLHHYPKIVEKAAICYEPHLIVHYLRDLAQAFHAYYGHCVFLVEVHSLRNARLNLLAAVQQVVKNGLGLLGVGTLEVM